MQRLKIKSCTQDEKTTILQRCTELDFEKGQGAPYIFRREGERVLLTDTRAFHAGIDRGTLYFDGLELYLTCGEDESLNTHQLLTLLQTTLKGLL